MGLGDKRQQTSASLKASKYVGYKGTPLNHLEHQILIFQAFNYFLLSWNCKSRVIALLSARSGGNGVCYHINTIERQRAINILRSL